MLTRVRNWLFRSRDIREAQARLLRNGDPRVRAARQVKLLVEVARRVAEPIDALPEGSRAAVQLALFREALPWALVAAGPSRGNTHPDVRTLWKEQASDRLVSAGHDLDALRTLMVDAPGPVALDASDAQADRARAFMELVVSEVDGPAQQLARLRAQRWIRLAWVGAVLVLLALGGRRLTLGPDLAADKPFRTSSSWDGCASDAPCTRMMFHTNGEDNPWVEVDLGSPHAVRRIEVTNREDCCRDRAVPLIVEVSVDRNQWTEVARRDAEFEIWTATFPRRTARYVRLRVPRNTPFHLQSLSVR